MERAIEAWLSEQKSSKHGDQLKVRYTLYGCLLLISHTASESNAWRALVANKTPDVMQRLYELITHYLKVSHIAITNPIPATTPEDCAENIIRAPCNFQPVYGDFGPSTATSPPTQQDFDSALWVTAKQNGIFQTWAPRWTMFSRGNISEKARILELDSVVQAIEGGNESGKGCTAVDLYAGIGYFTFSYLKAGVSTVLCWDLNEWSCEGLGKGAKANHWEAKSLMPGMSTNDVIDSHARLFVFDESNEHASSRVQEARDGLPPIRHVNCGLLPTSRGSWQTALDVIDPELGGWLHIHENFGIKEIEQKSEEVRSALQEMQDPSRSSVELQHVNRLKSYAPGVIHCVLDIYIPGSLYTSPAS